MMRCDVRAFVLVVLFGFSLFPAFSADLPFSPGELIRYNIKQMGVKVGTASLLFAGEQKLSGQPVYLIVFTSRGFNFYDQENIYVDTATFRPLRVVRDLNIFGSREKITEAYGPDGRVHVRKFAGGRYSAWTLPKQGAIDNIYGFIYRYRSGDIVQPGQKFELSLPTMNVVMYPDSKMNFKAAGKIYPAVLIKSIPSKYSIWMDTGPRRLPLRIAGAVGMANTVMTMVDHEEK